jgi:hypothetical protein
VITKSVAVARLVRHDPSNGFLAYTRRRITDGRAGFRPIHLSARAQAVRGTA